MRLERNLANFFLIDHSLRKSGGHHFDYVNCLAKAASQLGLLTTIGANRGLSGPSPGSPDSLERYANVRRVFRETTYQPGSELAGLRHLTRSQCHSSMDMRHPNRVTRLSNRVQRFRHRRRRDQFIGRFASDCERYFRPLLQLPGDHALLTTVSELELLGLAEYLSRHPQALKTHWHLQFHFNLFEGRTPEYDSQHHVAQAVRSSCLAALARLSYHSIHFYTTSETLVDQYDRLGVGRFEVLPYPVSNDFAPNLPAQDVYKFEDHHLATAVRQAESKLQHRARSVFDFGESSESTSGGCELNLHELSNELLAPPIDQEIVSSEGLGRRLRITCPGEVRREKGAVEYLQPLVDAIWPTHLETGKVQVVLQRPSKKWHSKKQKIELKTPADGIETSKPQGSEGADPIEYFSHPLSHDDYVELIKSTDCGLLFYDSRVYYSRRAGVLGELLSCGKPVIVPSGSWLAEQIQEPIYRHVDLVSDSTPAIRVIESSEFGWESTNVPMPGGVLSFDQAMHPFNFVIERSSEEALMVLEFDWHWPTESGIYCRCELVQKSSEGEVVDRKVEVLGVRKSTRKVKAIFRMSSSTRVLEFSLTNAFHASTASIKRVKLRTFPESSEFATGAGAEGEVPWGSVGVIAADREDLPNCVDEIVKHYEHYRSTAVEFSKRWYNQHDPQKTVQHLLSAGEPGASALRRVA
ncbi:MAG: hypothetical protein ACI814_001371 [Mariniblastus sp.]|jgi:hypothetical protein